MAPEHYIFYSFSSLIVFSITLLLGLSIDKFVNEIGGTYINRLHEMIEEKRKEIEKTREDLLFSKTSLESSEASIFTIDTDKFTSRVEKLSEKFDSAYATIKKHSEKIERDGKNTIIQNLRPCIEVSMLSAMVGLTYLFIAGMEHANCFSGEQNIFIFAYALITLLNLLYFIRKVKRSNHNENSKFEIFGRVIIQVKRIVGMYAIAFVVLYLMSWFNLMSYFLYSYPEVGNILMVIFKISSFHLLITVIALSTLFIPMVLTGIKMRQHSVDMRKTIEHIFISHKLSEISEEASTLMDAIQSVIKTTDTKTCQ